MDIQIYRCEAVFLLVPDLLLPAYAAQKLHGPCHRIATVPLPLLQRLVPADALDAMLSDGFAALPLEEGIDILASRTSGNHGEAYAM